MYPNQIKTAQELITAFMGDDKHQYCVLLAQMQSGKSDTFMLVGSELVRLGLVERFVVFSGNSEIELRDQAKDQRTFFRAYRSYLRSEMKFDAVAAEKACEKVEMNFTVLWSSDLAKHRTKGKTLYIWDESHFAQSSKQRPDKFFRMQGLQPDGSPSENGNLMLSVSATPFSELLDNDQYEQKKKIIKMDPGAEYIGVSDMITNKCIKGFSGPFNSTFASILPELLKKDAVRRVGLVRMTIKNEQEIRTICANAGVNFLLYDQKWSGEPINDLLQTFTGVIGLKGKVRMGKQIIKNHVAWCFETAVRSNTDTLLQGLIGRCCGYPSTGSSLEIKMYVPQKMITSGVIQDYGGMMNGEDAVPAPAMNVKKHTAEFYTTIPEKCTLKMDDWDSSRVRRHGEEDDLKAFIRDYIKSSEFKSANEKKFPGSTTWLKKVVDDHTDRITFSKWTAPCYKGHLEKMEQSYSNNQVILNPGSSCGYTVSDGTQVRVWSKEGRPANNQKTWNIYLQFLTPVATLKATTTKREVFCRHTEEDETVMDNGAMEIGLPVGTASNVEQMKTSILEAIKTSQSCVNLVTTNKFTSQATNDDHKWQGIAVTNEVLKALMPKGIVYQAVLNTFQVSLKVKKARGRRPANFPTEFDARLTVIEW
jgi:hypothetical protein